MNTTRNIGATVACPRVERQRHRPVYGRPGACGIVIKAVGEVETVIPFAQAVSEISAWLQDKCGETVEARHVARVLRRNGMVKGDGCSWRMKR